MSGTAPSDPAPGGHANDRGVDQTPLDTGQRGQTQNIIDETNDTARGAVIDRDMGQNIDAGKGSGLAGRVDEILNQPSTGGARPSAVRKGQARDEQGFKVGEKEDLHELAKDKQP